MGPVLRDIHLPPEPSWWPPAPGWWILAVALLAVLFWFARTWREWAGRRRWERAMRHEFAQAAARAAAMKGGASVAAVSEFLRRVVRTRDPVAATLSGQAWLDYLNARGGQAFDPELAEWLRDGAYRDDPSVDTAALVDAVRLWLDVWMLEARRA